MDEEITADATKGGAATAKYGRKEIPARRLALTGVIIPIGAVSQKEAVKISWRSE
jgi:hypothetical protein